MVAQSENSSFSIEKSTVGTPETACNYDINIYVTYTSECLLAYLSVTVMENIVMIACMLKKLHNLKKTSKIPNKHWNTIAAYGLSYLSLVPNSGMYDGLMVMVMI